MVKRDTTLQHPRCVINLMRDHYSRYDLDTVSRVTGVSKADLSRVYDAYCATGKPDKAGAFVYALGWTQHSVGVQNIRISGLIQQLLGNVGNAGGGIAALRGEPNVQGTTDHALLYGYLPGYHNTPTADYPTLDDYLKSCTPKSAGPHERQLVAEPAQVRGQPAQELVRRQRHQGERLRLFLGAQDGPGRGLLAPVHL